MAGKHAVISYLNTYSGSNAILDDSGGIDASIETITVDAAYSHGFVVNTLLIIDSEYMLVTAVTDTHTLTVIRGYNNSTPAIHADNAAVYGVHNWVDIVHSGTTNSALISLEFVDVLGTPTIALVRIQNRPVDSSAANAGTEPGQFTGVFTDFMKIRIKDAETQLVYFYGVVFSLTETYEPQWGMVLDLDCRDYLSELKDNTTQGYAGFEIDPTVALSTYVTNFAKSNIDENTNLNKTAIGGRSAIIKSLITATTPNITFDPADDRFEDSVAVFEQAENYELGPKNQKSVLQHIASISATDPHDVTANEQFYGYDFYVDPNFTSTASGAVGGSAIPTAFFNYFKKGTRPNVTPATYGLNVESPSTGGFVEDGRKVPMMDFEFNRPKGEILTDAIVTYKFMDESSEDGSTAIGSKTTTFEVIEIKAVANLSSTVPRWKGLPIASGYKAFNNDDGVLLPEWLQVQISSTWTTVARMQYINRTTGTINDANPVYMLISDVDESIASGYFNEDTVWRGKNNTSSTFTIKSRPRSKYGVRRSLTMTVGESVKPNTIRQKIAAALMRNSVQVIRGSFSSIRRPEYYIDNSPSSVATNSGSDETITLSGSVNPLNYGFRVGMPVVKLVNSDIPNTGVVYGYASAVTSTTVRLTWNTGTVSASETLRFIVPVRAGDVINVTNPLVSLSNNKFLVTKVVYSEQPGVSNTEYTVVGAETNREGGYAAKNFQSAVVDSIGQAPNLPPAKPNSGNIGESGVTCTFTSASPDVVTWTAGDLTIGNRRFSIFAGSTVDSMIPPADGNTGQASSPLAEVVSVGETDIDVDDGSVFNVNSPYLRVTPKESGGLESLYLTSISTNTLTVTRTASVAYAVDQVLYEASLEPSIDYYIYYPGTGSYLKTVRKSSYRYVVGNEPDPIVIGWCKAGTVEAEFSVWVQEFSMGSTKGDAAKKLTKYSLTSILARKGMQAWSTSAVFTGTAYNAFSWGSSAVSFGDDTTETIDSGTRTMSAALEYVYKIVGDSPNAALQFTTTYSAVYTDNAILLATVSRATDTGAGSPTILPFNGNQATISAGVISAGAILAGNIKGGEISTKISSDMTGITMNAAGQIFTGTKTYNSAEAGWILENNSGTPRFEIGETDGNYLQWSGSALNIKGSIVLHGSSTTLDETNTLNTNTTAANVGLGNVDNTTDASVLSTAGTNANSAAKTGGTVGGWTLASDALYVTNKQTSDGYQSDGFTIAANGSIHSTNFFINSNGVASFKGTLTVGGIDLDTTNTLNANTTAANVGLNLVTNQSATTTVNTALGGNHTGNLNSLSIASTSGARVQFSSTGISGYDSSILRWAMSAQGTPLTVYGPGGGAAGDAAIKFENGDYRSWISAGSTASDTRYDAAHHQFQNFDTPEGFITGLQAIIMAKTSGDNTISSADGGNLVLNALGSSGNVYIKHNNITVAEYDSTNSIHYNNVIPHADSTYNLGQFDKKWAYIYADSMGSTTYRTTIGYFSTVVEGDLILDNLDSEEGNNFDGTKGHWLIQEGIDDLFIENKINGKKYKFKLEEI